MRARTAELEAFTYSVSHDLRAPLRAINGFAQVLEDEYSASLPAEGLRLLSVVRGNARRMGALIDDLLAFARAGRQDLNRARVDMEELVGAALDEVLPPAERERTDLELGPLPSCTGDAALLRQVWVNLLSNAVKFSAPRERRRIAVRAGTLDGCPSWEVEDNGVGFDMRYAGKLFEVFERLHGREFEGTGVGLALVRRIVTRHGGFIRAEGRPGHGATFTFTLGPESGGK